eukprot:GHVU01149478.1.p1 GENE.GHVU01149478.1~~GHVU01149478.1.p1  ORF type:complete len:337 (+),score=86.19 GHVU01149478.1:594-1604(+)
MKSKSGKGPLPETSLPRTQRHIARALQTVERIQHPDAIAILAGTEMIQSMPPPMPTLDYSIVNEEVPPSVGLFQPPPSVLDPPPDGGIVAPLHIFDEYGRELAVVDKSRSVTVIGSRPKQCHVIDKHTSVYSQHVALVHMKGRNEGEESGMYVMCLGGQINVWPNSKYSFLPAHLKDMTDNAKFDSLKLEQEEEARALLEKERMDKVREFYLNTDNKSALLPRELQPTLEELTPIDADEFQVVETDAPKRLTKTQSCFQIGSNSDRLYFVNLERFVGIPPPESVAMGKGKETKDAAEKKEESSSKKKDRKRYVCMCGREERGRREGETEVGVCARQ